MQDKNDNTHGTVRLTYSKPILILGGGDVDEALLRHFLAKGYPLICADGAGDLALGMGVMPDAVIGDFDSLKHRDRFDQGVHLIEIKEQMTTDFEKCLYSIEAPLFMCFGLLGKRLDHELATYHVMAKWASEKRIILIDGMDVAYAHSGSFEMAVQVGARFSLYPLSPIKMAASTGLAYNVGGLTLAIGEMVSTSNHAQYPHVKIVPAQGHLQPYLIIAERTQLDALIETVLHIYARHI